MSDFQVKTDKIKGKNKPVVNLRQHLINVYRNQLSAVLEMAKVLKIDCCKTCGRKSEKS